MERTSNGVFRASTSNLPNACTASVWNTTPRAFARRASASIGWTTPISLLTHITEHTDTCSVTSASNEAVVP